MKLITEEEARRRRREYRILRKSNNKEAADKYRENTTHLEPGLEFLYYKAGKQEKKRLAALETMPTLDNW